VQTTHGGAVGVQRSQLMMVSAQEVEQASNQQYQQMVAEARSKNALDRDPATVQRVRRIVSRLAAQTGAFRTGCPVVALGGECVSPRPSSMPGAWPAERLRSTPELSRSFALSDDEIAAIMGHEIAHALQGARARAGVPGDGDQHRSWCMLGRGRPARRRAGGPRI
jgi:Zn-dependent protease with chaperone function